MTPQAFLQTLEHLRQTPFPDRYALYKTLYPQAPRGKHPRRCTLGDVALLVVMSQNWSRFGVKRMTQILGWPGIRVHHILQCGLRHNLIIKESRTMYTVPDQEAVLAALKRELGDHA